MKGELMKVVIVGCGRVGSSLAKVLASEEHDVTIIDREARSMQRRLDPDFSGTKIIGNAMDEDVLVRADIRHANLVITLTEGDNRNIMIAQVAKVKFGVPKVLARIVDPLRAAAYRELGIESIDQTTIMTDYMKRAVLGDESAGTPTAGE